MGVTGVEKDLDALTMTVTADYDVPVERAWELFAEPRQLERWWGPPTYPVTVSEHDLRPGGRVAYVMTGPEGDRHHGWWEVLEVEPPRRLVVRDGFADESGVPNPDLPTMVMHMEIADHDGGARMVLTTTFGSLDQLEQLLAMGMEEGLLSAMSQIDGILAG